MLIKINCPGGTYSQTGIAACERYSGSEILPTVEIEQLMTVAHNTDHPFCAPIWNSNIGEIGKSKYIWDEVIKSEIKIQDLWAKGIEFWHIKKPQHPSANTTVGSVEVVNSQCSQYIQDNALTIQEFKLSNWAFDAYKAGAIGLNGVLIAPQANDAEFEGYEVVSRSTVNPNNFTSFVRFQHKNFFKEEAGENHLTGVEMRPLLSRIGESEQEFFKKIFESASDLNDVPRLIFVFNRTAKVGLLFESNWVISIEDILDIETIEKEEISIHNQVGCTNERYSQQVEALLNQRFPHLTNRDFIIHERKETCMFICPALGIFTHGYERETVEPIIRFYISNFFQAIYNGVNCTQKQRDLFTRHRDDWLSQRSEFIKFETV